MVFSCYESESETEVSDDCDNYFSNENDTKTKIVTWDISLKLMLNTLSIYMIYTMIYHFHQKNED